MFGILALLFVIVPFAELFILLQVGRSVGTVPTVAALIVVSVVGAWLVKREGLSVVRKAQQQVRRGQVPGRELVDGGLILFGGALLLTPGFLTDVLGIALLIPPVRSVLRTVATARLARRAALRLERF